MARQSSVNLKNFYGNIMKGGPLFYGHQFLITFTGSDLPEAMDVTKGSTNASESFTYYVKSSKVPKVEIDEAKVAFLSQDFVVPKQVKYDGSWDVNVLMDGNLTHYRTLYDWQEQFSSLRLNGGGIKVIPDVNAHVGLLDSTFQKVIHRFTLVGVFPSKIPDLAFQYENAANLVDFNCTFTYQYMYDEDYTDPFGNETAAKF